MEHLSHQPADYPNFNVDFDTLLEELNELEEWDEKNSLSGEQIREILLHVRNPQDLLMQIFLWILGTTTLPDELEGIFKLDDLYDIERFIKKNRGIIETQLEPGVRAMHYRGIIYVNKSKHERNIEALLDLSRGIFPDDLISILHEVIHVLQKDPNLVTSSILREIQAYKAENEISDFGSSTSVYISHIENCERTIIEERDRIIMACQQIERLRALGYSQETISQLVENARWDVKRICYDLLDDAICTTASENGLGEEQIDTMIDKRRIQRQINLLKTKKRTHEVLSTHYQP